jgi:hypothetical protein
MPTFIAEVCDQHPGCTVINCQEDDGRISSRSHAPDGVRPEARMNLDHPDGEDRRNPFSPKVMRWALPDDSELKALGFELTPEREEHRRRLAFHAAERAIDTKAALAQAVGVTVADLDAEADAKGWDIEARAAGRDPR